MRGVELHYFHIPSRYGVSAQERTTFKKCDLKLRHIHTVKTQSSNIEVADMVVML
jgi:peptidase E